MLAALKTGPVLRGPRTSWRPAADLLHDARAQEHAARISDAIASYEAAIAAAEGAGEPAVLAESLRRLAVIRHHRNESDEARRLCHASYTVSHATGNDLLARYGRSLQAYRKSNDEHGRAIAYHNLGMASADRERFDEAEHYFRRSHEIAERAGDAYLGGLCLVNHAKVHVARERYEDARHDAEAALAVFDQLGVGSAKADAYRVLGMIYRETGRPALAESRLKSAIELAVGAGSGLNEAEASRELALLYQTMGRNQEALGLLNAAHRLFGRLDARAHLVHVAGKMAELEAAYLAVVREWGQSLESADTYTFGHCERVARLGVAVARTLGLDEHAQTTVRLGAYLHDLGKVRVPHEILSKPGPLTRAELEVVQMHPIWGIELLAKVEFPWDIKPVIRWHHERYDGTGYPDRLCGDEIPVAAQIVGVVDVYDALTTTRPYRPAFSRPAALAQIDRCRGHWSDAVFSAFCTALALAGASHQ